MRTATKIKTTRKDIGLHQAVYCLDPPLLHQSYNAEGKDIVDIWTYVLVSSLYMPRHSIRETHIFGSNEDGEVLDWGELPGSITGTLNHHEALNEAGYAYIEALTEG